MIPASNAGGALIMGLLLVALAFAQHDRWRSISPAWSGVPGLVKRLARRGEGPVLWIPTLLMAWGLLLATSAVISLSGRLPLHDAEFLLTLALTLAGIVVVVLSAALVGYRWLRERR